MAIEVFKITTKNTPHYLQDLIKIKHSHISFRYTNRAEIPQVRTTRYGLKSLRYEGAKLWNELPDHLRKEQSYNNFKSLINQWSGESCRCFACHSA